MIAKFYTFSDYENNSTLCEMSSEISSAEIFNVKIDNEKISSVNYYKIEGRIARFSIISSTLLRNRRLYKHKVRPELTRIAVKIFNDFDEPIFFGIAKYSYRYDN